MVKKTIHTVLAVLILLSIAGGCEPSGLPGASPAASGEHTGSAAPSTGSPSSPHNSDGKFTVRYSSQVPVNPITGMNKDNLVLSSLMYESLFTLDENLIATPALCESWETEDNITYTLKILPDIAMSDGSMLTAGDVVYSLSYAKQGGLYANRLGIMDRVESDGDLSVTVVLNYANARFIQLLDIPIIKQGSIDEAIPAGTGPYLLPGTGAVRLVPNTRHRNAALYPVSEIRLLECEDQEVAELFDSGELSLLLDDPSDTFDIILNRHNEPRMYDTTAMHYIGYNARNTALGNADVRRAIGSAIDREALIDAVMPGQPRAALLALSPAYRLYDPEWEQMATDPLIEMSALLLRADLQDYDFDSFLEYPDESGGYSEISLDFIVNSNNTYKVNAARMIADTMRLYGIEIIVRTLPWDNFIEALETGDFDMYYGEIVLGADFDFRALLSPGSRHDYGLTGDSYYEPYIESFLSAQTDSIEREAAGALCVEIDRNAPFVPILYKRYTVYTPIGVVTGAAPSQSGVFCDFVNWKIDSTMLP